jgi:4-hydroxy-3-methylbut-2-en-1-yl diphosphate synthase IspG/GcpE
VGHIGQPIPCNTDDYRQCVVCDHICGDLRVWNETPIACPSCGRKGIWLDAVDWSTCDADAAIAAAEKGQ